jgi:hypothetical protein
LNNVEFKKEVITKLLQIPSAKLVSENQIQMRCQVCGDSKKDPNKARFYVKVDMKNDIPILYHCWNCQISGILTPSLLRSFKVNDLQLNSSLLRYNNTTMGQIKKSLGIINNDFNFVLPIPVVDEKTMKKKEYIENRLGISFTIEELVRLKTIFNLGDFLRENEINTLTVKQDQAKLLHDDYVGFLSANKEFIIFRDITGKNKRYHKYSIFKNLDNTRKFYTIPNKIDILTNKTITINIAEGVFDIIGIYHHIYEKETNNMIYAAVNDSGYITVLKYFIQIGLIGNIDVNIYSDSDREPRFYKEMSQELKEWINKITLFYNEKGKDYGVKKSEISIIKKKII